MKKLNRIQQTTITIIQPNTTNSVADELKKFTELKDTIIIFQSEFNDQKNKLLGN